MSEQKQITMWFDTETTGLLAENSAVVQIAIILEKDFKIIGTFNEWIKPHDNASISKDALNVIGYTIEELEEKGSPPEDVYRRLVKFLDHHCDKYDKLDKMLPAGYNTRFDLDMLLAFFQRNDNPYLFSYLHGAYIDVMALVAEARYYDVIAPRAIKGNKLKDVCKFFSIEIKAHDAYDDITATMELHRKIWALL